MIEDAIPPSPHITRFISDLAPDLVLASPVVEFASSQVEYLKSACALGVRTGVCVASWDNLTNKGLIRFRPNRVFVWNEIQRDEVERYNAYPRERVVATGAPRFDPWFGRGPSVDRGAFMDMLRLDASRPYVLYLCSSPCIAPDEVSFVRRWLAAIRSADDSRLRGVGVLVRPHPQHAAQWENVDLGQPNVTVWPKGGAHPDAGAAQDCYFNSMAHSAAVVGINTSALIEAGIVGKSVYTLLDPAFAGTQEGTLHFHYLRAENAGFVHATADLAEHLEQLSGAIGAATSDRNATQAFVRSFVRPRDPVRPAALFLADEIEHLALADEPAAGRPLRGARAVRLALTPLAAATTLASRLLRPR